MGQSRIKKSLINTGCELSLEVVTAVCSFILPRLMLANFGSAYNGITQSISQFIGCVALLKSGIGSVTRVALFKPLAQNDSYGISEVTNATERFMRKIAGIFFVALFAFAVVYPFFVQEDFEWFSAFSLVLILSISTVAQYCFGMTYQMVLQADQRYYVISLATMVSTILNTIVAAILILEGCTIHIVKLGSAIVFILPPLFYYFYVRKKYRIQKEVPPNYEVISQRWDAFGQELANFIIMNTDVIVITVILGVKEVSVYTIYYMIANAVKKLIKAVSTGTSSAFGNMLAKNEKQVLKNRFGQYELLIFMMSTLLFTIAGLLFIPFIRLYTSGITDVNYIRPVFAVLVCISSYFMCTKLPYEQLVYAAGEFKKTKKMAYMEAVLNISLSVILSHFIGLSGVVIGSSVAALYRTIRYDMFVSKHILERSWKEIFAMLLYTVLIVSVSTAATSYLPIGRITSYVGFFAWAVVVSVLVAIITCIITVIMYRKKFYELRKMLWGIIRRGR